jgi:O-antigen ligase
MAGHGWAESFKAVVHDMRTFGFIVLLWPLFANARFAQYAMWALFGAVIALASANLLLVLVGYLPPGKYFWPTAPHMYGQTLVGLIFLLAQMQLVRPKFSWQIALAMLLLVASLFMASERRTGYLQLAAGFVVWVALNYKRLFVGRYKWWIALGGAAVVVAAILSPVVQSRMAMALLEVNQYLGQSTVERANNATSVGIRMQFYVSAWAVVVQNLWVGVGSIDFPVLFQQMNAGMGGVTNLSVFTNPHNEYIYILATKGMVGLVLYLAIFGQACRMALAKSDEVQRVGLLVFVFLFMLSITTNSMMIDMEEGHFTMLIMLIFLSPKSLGLDRRHADRVNL